MIEMKLPEPIASELPVDYADRLAAWYSSQSKVEDRKSLGQYMTPAGVARFMAAQIVSTRETVRLLDPGAGTGILTCALCERLVGKNSKVRKIDAVAYELHPPMALVLHKSLKYLETFLAGRNIQLSFKIEIADFVLSQASALNVESPTLFGGGRAEPFDVVIANPPYFKIAKSDPRAQAASAVVYGQPNIYGLFMAVSASLLREKGQLIFITPRSFASGPYFQRFREWFFARMQPHSIHVFGSRRATFRRDEVLQENVILAARRKRNWSVRPIRSQQVTISTSEGMSDLRHPSKSRVPLSQILVQNSHGIVLRIPDISESETVREIVDCWQGSLATYGLWISTGPVVPFRATDLLSDSGDIMTSHAPLLWMQHVDTMSVTWPLLHVRKPQFIKNGPVARKLLVRNDNYVLIRRFSAKEQHRRLTAAPYERGTLHGEALGLENHLNYLYRPHGSLSPEETWGLAALFNSFLLDAYFRSINGNTQVSATELRHMPLPSLDIIREIGRRARKASELQHVDELIEEVLHDRRIHSLRDKPHD
ncbi:MAG: Eco57I restriction-modification methylase domain-containing protein [candidate division Zixibacteria bacterium]|nr:Eco57I restriction-modification methylase domain-containing protein [candidate division Zixibacteria bacterium]